MRSMVEGSWSDCGDKDPSTVFGGSPPLQMPGRDGLAL
jgi:hypothetical protein